MKKFIFCTALVMLFTSCMKNDVEVDAVQRTEDFTATFADGTRADLDGTAVVWNADDYLTIFTKTSHNRQYKVKDLSANGRSATFEYVGYTGSDKTPITNNYAVYPYDATATISGDVITTALASEQIYNSECDLTYALMSAKSSTNNFSFVNSGALLRFNISTILPDTFDLNYIKVSSQSHNIAGEVTIDTNNHLAVVANNGTNEITLAEINETIDSDVKSFYIAMPAMSFAKSDLSVTFSFADGDKTFALPAFDLEQGKIKSIDYTIKDADEFTGNTPGEDVPAAAKPANNEIWYTTKDNTKAGAASSAFGVNIISNTCENGIGIIKFDDDVTEIGSNAFTYNNSLTSITFPESVTSIANNAIYGCSALASFYGKFASEDGRCLIIDGRLNSFAPAGLTEYSSPDGVTTIGPSAFFVCSNLTSVTIGVSVTTIGGSAFRSCSSLTSITIPDSVTTIGDHAFMNCSSLTEFNGKFASEDGRCLIVDGVLNSFAPAGLTEYTIPNSVVTIGDEAFAWCRSLTSVTIPNSVTSIGISAFDQCTKLNRVSIGNSVSVIGVSAFRDCESLKSVEIPATVASIGDYAFVNCESLNSVYCNPPTPPTGGFNMFYNNDYSLVIYVPSNSIEAYKTAEYWEYYRIR